MTTDTTLRQLIEDRLPKTVSLEGWVEQRRRNGQSWRSIASELRMVTETDISHVSLLRWFHHE